MQCCVHPHRHLWSSGPSPRHPAPTLPWDHAVCLYHWVSPCSPPAAVRQAGRHLHSSYFCPTHMEADTSVQPQRLRPGFPQVQGSLSTAGSTPCVCSTGHSHCPILACAKVSTSRRHLAVGTCLPLCRGYSRALVSTVVQSQCTDFLRALQCPGVCRTGGGAISY